MHSVYIYLFDDMDSLGEDFVSNNLHRLPAFRQEQCLRHRKETDKQACILAYLLLEKGLNEQYGISRPPEFTYNEHGKPYLRDTPFIFFNLSHCKHGVICALSDIEIGIDIQDIRPFDIDVASRVCSNKELKQLAGSDDPALSFCKIWARKESYAKAKGISIANVLKHDLTCEEFKEWESQNYCIALYAESPSCVLFTMPEAVENFSCRGSWKSRLSVPRPRHCERSVAIYTIVSRTH